MAALSTPFFLGLAPVFGKLALQSGADSFTVAALRTLVAVVLLWIIYALFARRYIYIYPAGLLGCIAIGTINGIGSLFYYGGLAGLSASMVQLINGSYLTFTVLLSALNGQRPNRRTLARVVLASAALLVITGFSADRLDWLAVGFMLANALMFAGTVTLSQYVLYEMPAPTVTLYILTTMGVVVGMVWLVITPSFSLVALEASLGWIVLLGGSTLLSRLTLFLGVKIFGSMQTAILALTEIGVALLLAALILDDSLTALQWAGVGLLAVSILLVRQEDLTARGVNPNALIVANMASVQFQRIAFHRAFGTREHDNEQGTMAALTTQEMVAIQRMMGAEMGGLDPFPIGAVRNPTQASLITSQEVELPPDLRRRVPPQSEAARRQSQEIAIPPAPRSRLPQDDDPSPTD
ncbi:MAG: DMT family transporter [Anaerolineae bacterium]|nr:DMT family transporter [Anaerolineae bacterium]MDW8171862.1 DMT family transporter [Anaerolineae bacterium]